MSSQTEAVQRLEEKLDRVQGEFTRELGVVRETQTRLERKVNDLPQQTRPATLPG